METSVPLCALVCLSSVNIIFICIIMFYQINLLTHSLTHSLTRVKSGGPLGHQGVQVRGSFTHPWERMTSPTIEGQCSRLLFAALFFKQVEDALLDDAPLLTGAAKLLLICRSQSAMTDQSVMIDHSQP